jgi:hypothetical protein
VTQKSPWLRKRFVAYIKDLSIYFELRTTKKSIFAAEKISKEESQSGRDK